MADLDIDSEREYSTEDQGFAALLATRYMFLDALDTGKKMGSGKYGTRKALMFLIPADLDVDQLLFDYKQGLIKDPPQPIVFFNKMRLMRQACQRPYNEAGVAHGN